MRPAANCDKAGIPGVVVAIKGFTDVAHFAAKAAGVEDLAVAEYPVAIGIQEPDEIRETIKESLMDQIVEGLISSKATSESPDETGKWNPKEIVFSGSLDEINDYFFHQGWSDGLAIIPPTIERIEKFVSVHSSEM